MNFYFFNYSKNDGILITTVSKIYSTPFFGGGVRERERGVAVVGVSNLINNILGFFFSR